MKIRNLLISLIFTVLLGMNTPAQDPEARLVDDYGNLPCEDQMARLDSYFIELQNDPAAQGHIFHYGSARAVAIAERQKRSYMRVRNMPPDRIVFVNAGPARSIRTQFWIVPPGAAPPEPEAPSDAETVPEETEPEAPAPDPAKPYIYSAEYYDGVICYGMSDEIDLGGYAAMLKENPKYRGNIVIIAMTKAEFRKKEKEIVGFLTKKGIARKRLRTFHKKTFGGVELWILP